MHGRPRTSAFVVFLGFAALLLLGACANFSNRTSTSASISLPVAGHLYESATTLSEDLQQALSKPVDKVNLFGGAYWFKADLPIVDRGVSAWVFEPHDTLIENVDGAIYGSDGSAQSFSTGYQRKLVYPLHYGQDIELKPGVRYSVAVRISSRYFASQPGFRLFQRDAYQQHVMNELFLIIAALGALLCLGVYNLFLFASTKDRNYLYYSLYLSTSFAGWAFTFHLPAALFGWRVLEWHYLWFFLIPITSTLFYLSFLQVKRWSPRLAKLSWAVVALALLLAPSSFFALPYTHTLATVVISLQMILARTCGVLCWRRGVRAARYFVLGFIALIIPGLFILPANVGLIPDLLDNAELITLLGMVVDGLLLAFALAERIRLLQAERDASLEKISGALQIANTDSMTGIGNRHAFDAALQTAFQQPQVTDYLLLLIDLDGLKRINDQRGHAEGDALLRSFAHCLRRSHSSTVSSYRLGGDEFVILAPRAEEVALRDALARYETELRAAGFLEFGASLGVAYTADHAAANDALRQADERMYQDKAVRRVRVGALG